MIFDLASSAVMFVMFCFCLFVKNPAFLEVDFFDRESSTLKPQAFLVGGWSSSPFHPIGLTKKLQWWWRWLNNSRQHGRSLRRESLGEWMGWIFTQFWGYQFGTFSLVSRITIPKHSMSGISIYMVSTPWGACEQNAHFDVKTQTIAHFCKIQARRN